MRILITGAAGFIGKNIFDFCANSGQTVIGWDIFEASGEPRIVRVDLLDEKNIVSELLSANPDIIIHCAGSADVGKSILNPLDDYQKNVTVTHNLLFALQSVGMNQVRVVFLSSAAVYGNPVELPICERAERKPLSPYALHKVLCEDICFYFHYNFHMDIKILRIFSAYGAGLRKQIFWDMYQKVSKTGKLELFGTGEESRDYIYIDDLLEAISFVANRAPKEEMIYNIANGEEVSILHAAEAFADAIGLEKEKISFSGVKQAGAPINWKADISKLKKLGYMRKVSFSEGIEKYVKWVRCNG